MMFLAAILLGIKLLCIDVIQKSSHFVNNNFSQNLMTNIAYADWGELLDRNWVCLLWDEHNQGLASSTTKAFVEKAFFTI